MLFSYTLYFFSTSILIISYILSSGFHYSCTNIFTSILLLHKQTRIHAVWNSDIRTLQRYG